MTFGTHGTVKVGGKTVKVGEWTIAPPEPPPASAYDRPEWLAFLRAILAEPGEDVHRLVAADWLEEHGEPRRAEFIRVQMRGGLHTLGLRWLVALEPFFGVQPHQLGYGAEAGRAWASGPEGRKITFRRGFADEVTCTAQDWLTHADSLVWRPEQTVGCPECVTDPPVGWYHKGGCPVCSGAGRVARPCPPTAEPITAVVLTTTMDAYLTCHGTGGWNDYPHAAVFWLPGRAKWSGAELNLGVADDGTEYRDMRYPQWSRHVFSRLIRAGWPHVAFTLPPA